MITSSPERIDLYTRRGWWGNTTGHMKDQPMAKFKLPEKMILVDVLPRNPMNKVLRNELEEMVKKNG